VEVSGAAVSRAYYEQVVGPLLAARWPNLAHAAGRLGSGSDVLGYDDELSRDHDWGLRLNLLVSADLTQQVEAYLDTALPEVFQGRSVRFATSWDAAVRHRVQIEDVRSFVASRTGLDVSTSWSVSDWLGLTGQAVLEIIAGPVFVDTAGELSAARERLTWYPDDLWRYVVATDWVRISQELPSVGRTAERGDDLGTRVITARLVAIAMHLGHLLERRWPPYAKWTGTHLAELPSARAASEPLEQALAASDWRSREHSLLRGLRILNRVQREVGLPAMDDPVGPFFDRPYRGIREEVIERLEESVTSPAVRALPRGVGSAEQWSDNVDVLVDPTRRLAVEST
jgi:Domain of unknown function (DUF4037)